MGLKVAILGMSPSKKDAPLGDPEWEKWGLPWDREIWVFCDRLFDIHDINDITYGGDDYLERLQSLDNLYMQEKYFPNVKVYPLEEVSKITGDYFTCSMAYMMGLAIKEADEIAIYGVDMSDEPYQHQRPNMEYLIGLARGMGKKVTIHDSSPLCKYSKFSHYNTRYGYVD